MRKKDRGSCGPACGHQNIFASVVLALLVASACGRSGGLSTDEQGSVGAPEVRPWPYSQLPAAKAHLRAAGGKLVPEFTDTSEAVTARVELPGRARGQIHIEDRATGIGVDVALVGATESAAQVVDGYAFYPKGHAYGALYQRAEPSGLEDYLALDQPPASRSITYDVALGPHVAGLRLIANQLEILDRNGAPRLRVPPPYIVGSDDVQTDAVLAVEGCALDTDPSGPWGRTITPPRAKRCRVRVSWPDQGVQYPALLDPRWQTTSSMSVARQDHNLIYLPLTGKVLAVGGRSTPTSTTGLASAELYDKTSGTWSATNPMSGGRWSASATLLASSSNGTTSQKILVAGGINGTTSLSTAQLYNQTAGTWAAAGTLNAARHLHTATLLNDGRVLVAGGMNGTATLTTAALYNPASGSGSWTGTTGPIPPNGWRFGTATLIATSNQQLNGKVLLAGGNDGTKSLSAVFLFDPAQSAFSTLASLPGPREGHQAVVLSNGKILLAGGKNGSAYLASAVLFDPSWGPGSWSTTGSMTTARWGHTMNMLPSGVLTQGLVLVSGGSNGTSTLSSTEYWNGTNWATDGNMVAPVQRQGAVGIGNSILIAGGAISNGATTVSASEIYDPSIGLGCTANSQCASGFCVSGVCCDSACDGGCGSCNLAGHLGVCTSLPSGSVCRSLTGPCDTAETCDGASLGCPADTYQPPTTVCRASAGTCDVAETCTGTSATCPTDVVQPSTTVCRPSVGVCDVVEWCAGTSPACPEDAILPDGTTCDDGNGSTPTDACTMGQCEGTLPCAPVATVASGGTHTCALRNDGSLWCWGDSTLGQVGHGSYLPSVSPVRAGSSTWRWSQVRAGFRHTCAIRIDQTLWCWGNNAYGQLGIEGSSDVASPEKVAGEAWLTVEAGSRHTCGLRSDQTLSCWGDNADGQLGDGTYTQAASPVPVSGGDWAGMAAGGSHTCAVKGDHTLWCWGLNADGQLGVNSTEGSPIPVQVEGTSWTSVSAGERHTCGVKLDGSLWCWGSNDLGQLGNDPANHTIPTRVGTAAWTSVSAGMGHTCAVETDGTLWCWGANDAGQLGDSSTTAKPAPVRILGQGWAAVSADNTHTCSRRQDGSLWCWGANDLGQLGDGSQEPSLAPKQVAAELCSQVPICGNGGDPEEGEECDDGNNTDGDGCSFDCRHERCFGIVCNGSDQCHGVCDPATGECNDGAKRDGTRCSDGNACTQTDQCINGACIGGNEVQCAGPANPTCFGAGVCDPKDGTCSNPPIENVECSITLRMDGTVAGKDKDGNPTLIAIFGYDSTGTKPIHPGVNQVTIDGTDVTSQMKPPAYLLPNSHLGVLLVNFGPGHRVTWTVDTKTASASGTTPTRTAVPDGNGTKVDIGGGVWIPITPNTDPYTTKPDDPGSRAEPTVGDAFNGTLSGQLTTSPTGAATYSVPIAVPPGIAGMAPNLSLVYSSQAGDGIAGQGWELSGLSRIHRCEKSRHQDGIASPLQMDANLTTGMGTDGICLDGSRLFSVGGGGCSIAYRAEFDDQSVISYTWEDGGSGYFTVVTKSGEKRLYGLTDQSRVLFPREDDSGIVNAKTEVAAIWALERVEDVWGNYFEVTYNDGKNKPTDQSDFRTRGLIATEIRYTGHMDAAGKTTAPTFATVKLSYAPRTDVRYTRFRDSLLPMSMRLTDIATDRGTYSLLYKPEDKMLPSRLAEIHYCAKSSSGEKPPCLDPLVFGWTEGNYQWEDSFVPENGPPSPAPSTNYALPTETPGPGTQFVDLDGDGRLDYMQSRWGGESHTWRNTGTGWELKASWAPPAYLSDWNGAMWNSALADIDGDGFVDFLALGGSAYGGYTCPNNDYSSCTALPDWTCPSPCQPDPSHSVRAFLNRTQEGAGWVPDPIRSRPEDAIGSLQSVYLVNKYLVPQWSSGADVTIPDPRFRTYLGDIDGDGRAELIHFGEYDSGVGCCDVYGLRVDVLRSTDAGWVAADPVDFSVKTDLPFLLRGIRDINRDGLVDLATHDPSVFYLNVGPGKGDHGTRWRRVQNISATPWSQAQMPNLVNYGDVDGDGQVEVFGQTWATDTTYCCWEYGEVLDVTTKVTFSSGRAWSPTGPNGYQAAIDAFNFPSSSLQLSNKVDSVPQAQMLGQLAAGRFSVVDLNADGLADLVVAHEGGGQALINTGTTWIDLNGSVDKGNCPGEWNSAGSLFQPCDVGANPVPQAADPWHTDKLTLYKPIYTEPEPPSVPLGPFDAFVDLDGDGVTDRVQTAKSIWVRKRAWLNKFQPPVIKDFPNGLASPTSVKYSVITTADAVSSGVYVDNHERKPGTRHAIFPMKVVASVTADNGAGATNKTSYQYTNLRTSASGRGAVGFSAITVTDEASGVVTKTEYAQTYPFAGRPIRVATSNNGPLTSTTTSYCYRIALQSSATVCYDGSGEASLSPEMSLFVYPDRVVDTSYLRTSTTSLPETAAETILTETKYEYDVRGNPTTVTVTTAKGTGSGCSNAGTGGNTTPANCGESYRKQIVNSYGNEGSNEQLRGKLTKSVVTSHKVSPQDGTPDIVHQTDMAYRQDKTVALVSKVIELGRMAPLELHTLYDYDEFGNLTSTTDCADDFEHCAPIEPDDESRPLHRTTTTSYMTGLFQPPPPAGATGGPKTDIITTLSSYGNGRFPVKTRNAVGHTEYTAYEPLSGQVVQRTGPNGVYTCTTYDVFGTKVAETERCGSDHPLTTATLRYRSASSLSEFYEKLVTVTVPPSENRSYVYSDGLGRVVRTLVHSFDGGFSEARTVYDAKGRVWKVTKPTPVGDSELWTETHYDVLGRPDLITQELGIIDGTGEHAEPQTVSTEPVYQGSSVTTRTSYGNVIHSRSETKNALGKVASISDASGSVHYFDYDVEGRLTDTHPLEPTKQGIHVHYDLRGRKDAGTDPDLGAWTYTYNGFGDLIEQKDAKSSVTRLTYDKLGRMLTKTYDADTNNAATAEWVYDKAPGAGTGKLAAAIGAPDNRLAGGCPDIPYVAQTSGNRAGHWLSYDPFGNVVAANECADGETFSTEYTYDDLGRQSTLQYPMVNGSRLSVQYNYTKLGFLQYITDTADGKVYWKALAMNALGQVTREQTHNGVETVSEHNSSTGWLLHQYATAKVDGANVIQDLKFGFDPFGNLLTRTRSEPRDMADSRDTFTYDILDRLWTATTSTEGYNNSETYLYDAIGNLTQKAGKRYSYTGCHTGGGPHAVCSVDGGPAYSYDANGNMTAGGGRTVSYNAFNKVSHIEGKLSAPGGASPTIDFVYGPDGDRVVQRVGTTAGDETGRTVYIGLRATGKSLYERTQSRLNTEHVHFIYAGAAHAGNAFAVRVRTDNGEKGWTDSAKYYHFDHIGSITAVSDGTGRIVGPATGSSDATVMSFDAWGTRRNANGTPSSAGYWPLATGHREYTGHETVPEVGLVNMNGRVYDPELARFLSADPTIQQAADLQGYNRYSYVHNNPLKYTDPTGYYPFYAKWIGTAEALLGRRGLNGFGETVTEMGMATACAASYGSLCAVFAGLRIAQAVEMDGVSFKQAVLSTGASVAGSYFTGAMGSGSQGGLSVFTGTIATVFSRALSRSVAGRDPFNFRTVLDDALEASMWAALGYAGRLNGAMSQRSAVEQQGNSGQSFDEGISAALAEGGFGTRSSESLGDELLFDMEMSEALYSEPSPVLLAAEGAPQLSLADRFTESFKGRWRLTHEALGRPARLLLSTGLSLAGWHKAAGTVSPLEFAKSLMIKRGLQPAGIGTWGVAGTAVATAGGFVLKTALTYAAFEGGIFLGSAAGAVYDATLGDHDYSGVGWSGTMQVPGVSASWQP